MELFGQNLPSVDTKEKLFNESQFRQVRPERRSKVLTKNCTPIYRCIATHSKSPRVPGSPKPVIMLVTGDGSEKDPFLNFPDCVRTAISNGFAVEIWSWHSRLHEVYSQLHEQHGEDCKIVMLDEHRSRFCRQQ